MHRKCAISRPAAAMGSAFILLLSLAAARAQQPSPDQLNAIRSSCRSDFMANCSGVTPGGKDALECLKRNVAKLSAACQTAVNAIAPKPATPAAAAAPAPPSTPAAPAAAAPAAKSEPPPAQPVVRSTASESEELKAVQKACTLNDLVAHCSSIAPTSPEILPCLKANAAKLSPGCQAALGTPAPSARPATAAPAKKPAEPSHATAAPAASAPAAAAPARPTEAQTAAIRSSCRSDFMSNCAGVQPGGAEALQCLQRNSARLSPSCKSAVAAIGAGAPGGAPAAASAPTASAPAGSTAPAVAPLTPKPFMLPRQRLVIVAICNNDARTLCAGVPPGGGEIIACLAANAARLSPECYSALARESR